MRFGVITLLIIFFILIGLLIYLILYLKKEIKKQNKKEPAGIEIILFLLYISLFASIIRVLSNSEEINTIDRGNIFLFIIIPLICFIYLAHKRKRKFIILFLIITWINTSYRTYQAFKGDISDLGMFVSWGIAIFSSLYLSSYNKKVYNSFNN